MKASKPRLIFEPPGAFFIFSQRPLSFTDEHSLLPRSTGMLPPIRNLQNKSSLLIFFRWGLSLLGWGSKRVKGRAPARDPFPAIPPSSQRIALLSLSAIQREKPCFTTFSKQKVATQYAAGSGLGQLVRFCTGILGHSDRDKAIGEYDFQFVVLLFQNRRAILGQGVDSRILC